MKEFVLKEVSSLDISKELENIGFDKSYKEKAKSKFIHKNLKIYDLTSTQANILKQLALSVGADCATNKNVITAKIDISDAIIGGSISQLYKIAEKLKFQPFNLKELSVDILKQINIAQKPATKIVGILNITENSFSDGGKYLDTDSAIKHLNKLLEDGADIVDIGAESTKPGANEIDEETQLKRILPILSAVDTDKVQISIDTRSAVVAEECLKKGATIINDVSGLKYDKNMADVIAKYNATAVIQHSKNKINKGSSVKQVNNILDVVYLDLKQQTDFAKSKCINNIIVDVGIGFDKTEQDNWEIIRHIEEFKSLGYPIMLGVSRKSFLHSKKHKDAFTLAINSLAIEKGVDYLRVHDVNLHREFLKSLD